MIVSFIILITVLSIVYYFYNEGCSHEWNHISTHEDKHEIEFIFKCQKCQQIKTETIVIF